MDVKDAVRRGAALLDEKEPGWRDRIAPGELRMSDCASCVVGQVAGLSQVEVAEDAYTERLSEWGIGLDREAEHGFAVPGFTSWNVLRDAWIGYLKGHWE